MADPRRVQRLTALAVSIPLVLLGLATLFAVGRRLTSAPRRVLVVGDRLFAQAADEIGRRFRQEGYEPVIVRSCDQADAAQQSPGAAPTVFVESTLASCAPAGAVVVDPGIRGDRDAFAPPDLGQGVLFVGAALRAPTAPCQWWDTPGPGEDRPGLGQCRDGQVTVRVGDQLTPAGKERLARLLVAAVAAH